MSSLVVRYDERRLQRAADRGDLRAEEQLERAWSAPSRDNALIGLALLGTPLLALFGVFFHFFRTRSRALLLPWKWSLWGLLLGNIAVLTVIVADTAVLVVLAYAFGIPLDE